MNLAITLTSSLIGSLARAGDLASVAGNISNIKEFRFREGGGLNQASLVFTDTRTLAASTSEDLDLAGGLTDPFGATLAFTKIKAIRILAALANVNDVQVGGAAANAFVGPFGASTHKLAIPPGGMIELVNPTAAGWTVTAATGDLLKIANSAAGSSVTYDIILLGA